MSKSGAKPQALPQEMDLEKQYRDYKAQFEQWTEKNKSLAGTPAYQQYVQKFEEWEADVEKRRALLRRTREQQQQAAAQAAAAQASAQSAEHYAAAFHHQQQQLQQGPAMDPGADGQMQQMNPMAFMMSMMSMMMGMDPNQVPGGPGAIPPEMAKHAAAFASRSGHPEAQAPVEGPQLPPMPTMANDGGYATGRSVQLWGSRKTEYGPNDEMYRKWGPRANPPNHQPPYRPPPPSVYVPPGWMVTEAMKKERLIIAPQPPIYH